MLTSIPPKSSEARRTHVVQPKGAYRMLIMLLYGEYPYLLREGRGITRLTSILKFARLLGTHTSQVKEWLRKMEDLGYLSSLLISDRTAEFRIREPNGHS